MLIGLHGRKQAGKDTVYGRIEHLLGPASEAGYTVERASFADLLYRSAAEALGVDVPYLQEHKSDPRFTVAVLRPNGRPESEMTLREYLQRYGTEAHRNVFDDNFWVGQVDLSHERKIVVVTDVRFPNEAQAVLDAGGSVVQVVGPDDVEGAGDGHASETPLPVWMIDHALQNDIRDDAFQALDVAVLDLVLALLKEERA